MLSIVGLPGAAGETLQPILPLILGLSAGDFAGPILIVPQGHECFQWICINEVAFMTYLD